MTTKINNHVHYLSTKSMTVFATYEEALEDAKFQVEFKGLKKSPYDYVKICFIHSLNN